MTTTHAEALAASTRAYAIVDHARLHAADLGKFNQITAPLRTASMMLKDEFATGDQVYVANAPTSRTGRLATIVSWEASCYGYSIAHVRYAGVKRTYPASIFSLYR